MALPFTQKTLKDWAGWKAFRDGKMLFDRGVVDKMEYEHPFVSGELAIGIRGMRCKFELLSDVRTITGQFATGINSFLDYEAMTQDRNANNEEIKIVRPGQMPGVFALLDFLLHRHNMAEKRQQKTVLSDSHEQICIYLRDVVTFDTVQQGQM